MPHGVYFLNHSSLVSYVNGHPFLQQLNAACYYFVSLAYLDSGDRVQLGGGAAGTHVVVSGSSLYVGSQGSVKLTNAGGIGPPLFALQRRGCLFDGNKSCQRSGAAGCERLEALPKGRRDR